MELKFDVLFSVIRNKPEISPDSSQMFLPVSAKVFLLNTFQLVDWDPKLPLGVNKCVHDAQRWTGIPFCDQDKVVMWKMDVK